MRLKGPYRILVEGDTRKIGGGASSTGIGHLFQRLLTGDEAFMENLANLGITVRYLGEDDEFIRIPRMDE